VAARCNALAWSACTIHYDLATCSQPGGSTGGGRSLKHLIELMAELEAERIGLESVTESIDTTTPGGELVFHIFGALAEFERNLIRERTYAGLAAARARGRKGGRRKKLGDKQRAVAVDLYRQKKHTIDEICKAVGISRPTLYKYVAAAGGR
jgi:DNA invertase Pin-like site-specific DNA recombinase